MLDHVQHALVGPLDVLEDEHERLHLGELLGPAERGPTGLGARGDVLGGAKNAEGDTEQIRDRLALAADPELLERLRGRVDVGDSGRRLDHRGDRPERDALAVGQRPAGQHGRALDAGGELLDQPRLADAGVAEHGHERRAPVAHGPLVRVVQQLQFLLAPDEAGARPALARVEHPERAPRPHLLAGPDLDRAEILDLHRLDGQPARAGSERDRPGRRGLLQARCHVDGLAGHERRGDVLDDELARLDPDPSLEPELADGVEHRERGPHRTLCVILVRLRHAEGGHHGVAGELLDGAAVPLDLLGGVLEVARHAPADDLGIAGAEQRRRIDQVDEDHGCELAFHRFILGSGTG